MNAPRSATAHDAGCGCCLAVFVAIVAAVIVVGAFAAVVMGLIVGGS